MRRLIHGKTTGLSVRARVVLSLTFAFLSACLSRTAHLHMSRVQVAVFFGQLKAGAELLEGKDPYAHLVGPYSIPYSIARSLRRSPVFVL